MVTTTLYFGKINYNSEIHKIHSRELDLNTINKKILSYFVSGIKHEETVIFKKTEEEYSKEYEYELFGIEVYNNSIILGNISKNDYIYKKTIDKKNEIIKKETITSEEAILFYYDVFNEIVVFHTTNKFGHVKFIEVFENLLNKSFQIVKDSDRFVVSLKNNISSIDEIFEEINSLGKVKEIRIDIIPPNPDEDMVIDIKNKSKFLLNEMKDANVTKKSTIYLTRSKNGLSVDKNIIRSSIREMSNIHKDLDEVELLKKNYGEISAVNEIGERFNTNENKPLKHVIDEENKTKKGFKEIIGNIITSLF
ncbi:MAG: hypothetical protein ACRC6U_09650 [Fusobacteriaceae bacterium]